MNLILWIVHFALLAYSWPLIRLWWHGDASQGYDGGLPKGRKRWAVVASFLLPTAAWLWLMPCSIGYRWKRDEQEYAKHQVECRATRDRDIAFWREQALNGELHSQWLALDLLALWGVPVVEPPKPFTQQLTQAMLAPVDSRRASQIVPVVIRGTATDDDWELGMREAAEMIRAGYGIPQALPGAHEYSHGCDCRNCVRARTSAPAWLTGRPVAPPGWKTNPEESGNEIYL